MYAESKRSWLQMVSRLVNAAAFRYVVWAILLLIWELWGRQQSPFTFTYPTAIIGALAGLAGSGELVKAIIDSVQVLAIGYGMAVLIAVPLGLLAGRINYLGRLLNPLMMAFYVTPRLALIPLIIIWVGIGFWAKIAVVWLICFFAIFFNVLHGMSSVSRSYLEVANAYGANEWQILREVTLPAILPFIATGLRLGLGLALIGTVVAEFLIGLNGLGGIIVFYSARLRVAQVFAAVLVILIFGVTLMSLAYALERRISHWQRTERAFR
ncbi:MAG: ABC transporter permease [Anaerolineae bacterium]|nr:ABC transporter permease [Anaerolineae bacterium]